MLSFSNMTVYAENRRAKFDYDLLEKYTAGVEFTGSEVKSVRNGKISLNGAYVSIRGGEAFLLNAEVAPYQPKNEPADLDIRRARKLLLSKKELMELNDAESSQGLTIVPLVVYSKGKFVKLDIAIARGKKKFDKREAIKKRDVERELKRSL